MTEHVDVDSSVAHLLLAQHDTLHFSADMKVSDELYEKLGGAAVPKRGPWGNNEGTIMKRPDGWPVSRDLD
jgi:hypothetical protein